MLPLGTDPRYFLFCVPDEVIQESSHLSVEDVLDIMLASPGIFNRDDYFVIPLEQRQMYDEAIRIGEQYALHHGMGFEVVDYLQGLIRFISTDGTLDRHLRIIYVHEECEGMASVAH